MKKKQIHQLVLATVHVCPTTGIYVVFLHRLHQTRQKENASTDGWTTEQCMTCTVYTSIERDSMHKILARWSGTPRDDSLSMIFGWRNSASLPLAQAKSKYSRTNVHFCSHTYGPKHILVQFVSTFATIGQTCGLSMKCYMKFRILQYIASQLQSCREIC